MLLSSGLHRPPEYPEARFSQPKAAGLALSELLFHVGCWLNTKVLSGEKHAVTPLNRQTRGAIRDTLMVVHRCV